MLVDVFFRKIKELAFKNSVSLWLIYSYSYKGSNSKRVFFVGNILKPISYFLVY